MNKIHPLINIIQNNKEGIHDGIYSICSANEYVIEAVMENALKLKSYVLIEATANQVNQYGGYTGMKPKDFREFVYEIANRVKFPLDKIILGGDHLGPLTWKNQDSYSAMQNAYDLVQEYVLAGFTKIHIDTSMHLGDDNHNAPLDNKVIAERGALLCKASEEAYKKLKYENPEAAYPVYIIGSEVPIPGGIQDEEEKIHITKPSDFEETVKTFKEIFSNHGLEKAWEKVIGVVVQPGVEFGDDTIHEYNHEAALPLINTLKKYPNIVFEGHSTDYQTAKALREMIKDGIAILKVGPAVTFALREGLFALNYIENEMFKYNPSIELSNFIDVLDNAMAKNPENWKSHYKGTGEKIRFSRKYSLSDRCRYYLPLEEVKSSISQMLGNLQSASIPLSLISEFMPLQYNKIRNGQLENKPEALLKDRILNCIDDYVYAVSHK